MTARLLINPKYAAESRVEALDFSPLLATGQTVTAAAFTVTVYTGSDPSPSTVIGTTTISSPIVSPILQNGIAGTIYSIRCDATTTAPAATVSLSFYLAIIPDLP